MTKLSLVIPVYNVKNYLRGCLDSVLGQTVTDFETIVVDDGSTDESGLICDEYERAYPDRIRVIHQANAGLGGARNTGLLAAKGEYVIFLDSDDTVLPDMMETLLPYTETDADMVIFGSLTVDENGNVIEDISDGYEPGKALSLSKFPRLLLGQPSACVRMCRRDLFLMHDILFPPRVWYEDIRTTTKLYLHAREVRYVDKVLHRYLFRPGSITKNTNIARNREILDAFEDIFAYFKAHNAWERYHDELEYLALYHVLTAASVRVLRVDPRSPLLMEFAGWMKRNFPNYGKNPYLKTMPKTKKLAFLLVKAKQYRLLKLLFQLKN